MSTGTRGGGVDGADRSLGSTDATLPTPLRSLLTFLSAFWCGASILIVGIYFNLYAVQSVGWALATLRLRRIDDLIGSLIMVAGCWIAAPVFGMAFGRYVVRLMPPSVTERPTRTRRRLWLGVLMVVVVTSPQPYMIRYAVAGQLSANTFDDYDRFAYDFVRAYGIAAIAAPILTWLAGAAVPLLRYGLTRTLLDEPFILFLRRFSTFSDRSVMTLVLREAPVGVPLVFLTSTRSKPGDWNPFLVGFAGIKLRHFFRSVPIVLRVRDDEWRNTAEELIGRAATIVIDVSEESNAIASEVDMITKARRWSATLCLALAREDEETNATRFEGARMVAYAKSWRRAIPRLLLGAALNVYSALLWFYVGAMLMVLAAYPFTQNETYLRVLLLAPGFILVGAVVAAYRSAFVIPTMDGAARRALRAGLRGPV